MKRYSKTLALVFSLLLIVMMIPALPGAAYADDSPSVQPVESKAEVAEDQTPMVYLDREARRLNQIISRLSPTPVSEPAPEQTGDAKAPIQLGSVELDTNTPVAATYLSSWVKDENGSYVDPNDVGCTWYYGSSSNWTSIPEIPSDIGEHIILVPADAVGKQIRIVVTPKSSSQYTGTVTKTTGNVIPCHLDAVEVSALGYGFFVGSELYPYAICKVGSQYYYIDDNYIHYDYYFGEGNSWTQFPQGDYNWYSYIPFEAEGKFIKVIAYVMAEQDTVLGGPATVISDQRVWVIPFDEFFHDETVPSGWIAMDMDGDGYTWEAMTETTYLSLSGEDGMCISSASWNGSYGNLEPDNWLISPAVHVPPYGLLKWYATASFSPDFKEHYDVYIGEGVGLDVATWTPVFGETLAEANNYKVHSVSLNAYAGKDIHIAFRHHDCEGQLRLLLDGVSIDSPLIRVSGKTRYDTSIDVANRYLSLLGTNKLPLIFVATGDDFPDALAGSVASCRYGAPILLISPKSVASQEKALNYIENHLSDSGGVVFFGGKGAVPQSFENRISEMINDPYRPGTYMDRVSGKDRYDTNLKLLKQIGYAGEAPLLVCDGTNYADAATASATGRPVLLVGKNGLTADQVQYLNELGKVKIYVIGGKGAVSEDVFNTLKAYDTYGKPARLSGPNRAETAVEVAKVFFDNGSGLRTVVFAYGGNFPDCIAGGLLANYMQAPILYGDNGTSPSYTDADTPYFESHNYIARAFILGGASLVSDKFAMDLVQINFHG